MKRNRKVNDIKISKIPNKMHFQTQLQTRMQIVESKKNYKRSRDKKIGKYDTSF